MRAVVVVFAFMHQLWTCCRNAARQRMDVGAEEAVNAKPFGRTSSPRAFADERTVTTGGHVNGCYQAQRGARCATLAAARPPIGSTFAPCPTPSAHTSATHASRAHDQQHIENGRRNVQRRGLEVRLLLGRMGTTAATRTSCRATRSSRKRSSSEFVEALIERRAAGGNPPS